MTQLFTHQWFGTPDNLLVSCILLFVTPNIWRSHVLISTDADFRAIAPPNSRFESGEERERRAASGECRSQGREEHPARSYYPGSDDSIFRGTRSLKRLCSATASLFQNAEALLNTLQHFFGSFIFVETNPSDIPIFGNTGWWIMFRFLGRPLYYCRIRGMALPFAPASTATWNMRICYKLWVVSPAPE